ncbi:FHA domain-containing protein [Lyngbya aestuarii]|uniref:FHA domain-containing protein n=1 Tax=Lyngbya aestuarii TaxID=118322 RepID=UPI00403DF760
MNIEQRLGLYEVFLKLYENHRGLLDELLKLEKTGFPNLPGLATQSVTGVIEGQQVYLITNLVDGKTQTLFQSQGIWTIGRDQRLALTIQDRRLSRHHAAIQYVKYQGFYLVDFNSTNGSFINDKAVRGRMLLRDGDHVRLSNFTFDFFLCYQTKTLDDIPPDILAKLEADPTKKNLATVQQLGSSISPRDLDDSTIDCQEVNPSSWQKQSEPEEPNAQFSIAQFNQASHPKTSDSFASRQIQKIFEHS